MKHSFKLFILFILFSQVNSFSQENEKQSFNTGTIENQFNYIINKSYSYQDNKVIKKKWINSVRSQVLDSLKKEKNTIIESNDLINKQKADYKNLQQELENRNKNIEELSNTKDTISFLGIKIKKSLFKTVLGSIIALLLLGLLYTVYLFKNSNKITQKKLSEFNELESEFNMARTRSLEREQALNRRLQDEINKHKK